MSIRTEEELARVVQEYQGLRHAPDDSPDGRRRMELDAQIRAFHLEHVGEMRKGKPDS